MSQTTPIEEYKKPPLPKRGNGRIFSRSVGHNGSKKPTPPKNPKPVKSVAVVKVKKVGRPKTKPPKRKVTWRIREDLELKVQLECRREAERRLIKLDERDYAVGDHVDLILLDYFKRKEVNIQTN